MKKHDNDECHRSFILKQKIRFGCIGYGSRLSLSFILEKGDQNGQRTSGCFTAPTIRYEKIRSQSPYFSKGLGSAGDSDYVKKVMHEVKKRDYDTDSRFAQMIKNFQESDMKLNSERSLFDWASKQTYIQMANMMMAAAMLGIDSCPIEGYDQEKVEAYLKEKGYLNTAEFGVSVMASFGYRNQEITPKTRWKTEVIYEVIE